MDRLLRNKKAIIMFIAPAFILFTLVLFVPICKAIYYSFCNYKALHPIKFNGVSNYVKLFTKDKAMAAALKNSIFFMIFSIVSQFIMGLFLAALLTNIRKGRNLFKNIYYLPCVLSSAALGLLWMFVFTPKLGINQMMASFGWIADCTDGPQWLFNTEGYIILPIIVISFVALWQYVGQSMMLPMIATAMSLNAIGSLKFFDLVYNMIPEGFLGDKAHVLATHMYTQAFKFNKLGYGSAIGVVLLVMCLVVTVVINKFVKVESYDM